MEELSKILPSFKSKKILIIGDLILDNYIDGKVSRISPEAPVPVLNVKNKFFALGGAGNVASNISSLGGQAILFSFIGNDFYAKIIKDLLTEKKIDFFLQELELSTIVKTRLIGNNQQLLRIDEESKFDKIFNDEFKDVLKSKANEADVIIISDYAKGTITKDVLNFLSPYKRKIIVDPKPVNKDLYYDVYLVKPNGEESLILSNEKNINSAGIKLRKELNANILITKGEEGMSLFSEKVLNIPTYAKEVYDVSGAGDTVISVIALALASGLNLEKAAILANYAAGIVIEKKGTYSLPYNELKDRLTSKIRKIVSLEELKQITEQLKKENKKIVWTSGCFDLLHVGHVRYLKEAKKLGDILIIGLNSDESVKRIKGPPRPIQSETERAEIIVSLEFVDYLLIFSDSDATKCLRELQPHIYTKGGDYSIDTLNPEERKIIEDSGGEIKLVSLAKGKSTTQIIDRIKNNTNK